MLQAQDLVLGFARFLGGSFAGSRAAGVSTDASGVLTSKKTGVCIEAGSRSSTTISEKAPLKRATVEQKTLRAHPECEETIEAGCA